MDTGAVHHGIVLPWINTVCIFNTQFVTRIDYWCLGIINAVVFNTETKPLVRSDGNSVVELLQLS